MYGRIPFSAPTVYQLFQVVQTEPLRFPEEPLVSDDLKDLLTQMLIKVGAAGCTCRACGCDCHVQSLKLPCGICKLQLPTTPDMHWISLRTMGVCIMLLYELPMV